MGEAPDYYPVIQSARYLRVAPWDLAGLPDTAGAYCWVVWGLVCREAEASAQRQIAERQRRESRLRR